MRPALYVLALLCAACGVDGEALTPFVAPSIALDAGVALDGGSGDGRTVREDWVTTCADCGPRLPGAP